MGRIYLRCFTFRAHKAIYRFALAVCSERETINQGLGAKQKPGSPANAKSFAFLANLEKFVQLGDFKDFVNLRLEVK